MDNELNIFRTPDPGELDDGNENGNGTGREDIDNTEEMDKYGDLTEPGEHNGDESNVEKLE